MVRLKLLFGAVLLTLLMGVAFAIPSIAQETEQSTKETTKTQTTQTAKQTSQTTPTDSRQGRIEAGKKAKVSGIIIRRDGDKMTIRDRSGMEYAVNLTGTTKIQERKKNPFRGAKDYDRGSLFRGLWIDVEGRGADAGALDAEKIKLSEDDFREASSLESRVEPVEGRVGEAETRLTASEQNAQRLSGQLEELSAVANTAKGGAKAAQETADKAIAEIGAANQRIDATNQHVNSVDERVTSLDDYEPRNTININFKARSAVLSDEAKAALDEIANQAKNEKGYVIQVAGFASADGNEAYNRRLSERRADAVVRYLIENHDISQRRIITPFGYGELKPAAENSTREGRAQNRRVEVAILVSKGMADPSGAKTTGSEAQRQRTTNVPDQQ